MSKNAPIQTQDPSLENYDKTFAKRKLTPNLSERMECSKQSGFVKVVG